MVLIYTFSFFAAMRTKMGYIPFAVFLAANTVNANFAITTKIFDTLFDTLFAPRVKIVPFFLIALGYFEKRKKTDIQRFKYQSLSEPLARLELATYALRMRCSTN